MNQRLENIIERVNYLGVSNETQLKIAVNYVESFLENVISELITVSCLEEQDQKRIKEARMSILTYFEIYDFILIYFGNVNEFAYLKKLRRMMLKYNTFNHMELTYDLIKLKSTYSISAICKRKQLQFLIDKYIIRNVNTVDAYINELENELEQVPLIIDMVIKTLAHSFKNYYNNN